jgi:hypothetical protein
MTGDLREFPGDLQECFLRVRAILEENGLRGFLVFSSAVKVGYACFGEPPTVMGELLHLLKQTTHLQCTLFDALGLEGEPDDADAL